MIIFILADVPDIKYGDFRYIYLYESKLLEIIFTLCLGVGYQVWESQEVSWFLLIKGESCTSHSE